MSTTSVIIATYNYGRFLVDCLRSVLDQTAEPLEVIVVDDGSTDETSEVVASFGDRVRYLRQDNQGPGAARNRGLELAHGDYIAFCDGDDCYRPHSIERRAAVLDRYADIGLVFGDVELFFEPSGMRQESLMSGKLHFCRLPKCALEDSVYVLQGDILRALLLDRFVTMPTAMVRRSCLDRVGWFDESLRMQEDWDMWIRFAQRHEVAYVDQALADCRQHDKSLSENWLLRTHTNVELMRKLMASDDPAWRSRGRLLRRRLGLHLLELGYVQFSDGALAEARVSLLRGARYRPFDRRIWVYGVASWLPPAAQARLKRLKRRIERRIRCRAAGATRGSKRFTSRELTPPGGG